MGKQTEYETNNSKKSSSCRMVKNNGLLKCVEEISMRPFCLVAVAITIFVVACPSQAMASSIGGSRVERKSEKPQSTLIAFPRVGRSVSDQEYYMFNEEDASSPSNIAPSSDTTETKPGKRTRIHTRASKGSMMAFPRVGRSSPINTFQKFFGSNEYDHGKRSYDQGLTDAVQNNDLYQFLHSVLREIAKTQQLNGINNFGEY
jgi:hypothetical protein